MNRNERIKHQVQFLCTNKRGFLFIGQPLSLPNYLRGE